MRRFALFALACLAISCEQKAPSKPAASADEPRWSARLTAVETVASSMPEIALPGGDEFAPLRREQPIPRGSQLRTPPNLRATLDVMGHHLTLNHSTTVALQPEELGLGAGQLVVEHDGTSRLVVTLPTGQAVLHENGRHSKVAFFAGDDESTITIARGVIEVRHGDETFEGRAGEEMILPAGTVPWTTMATDLARQLDWSELSLPDDDVEQVPRGIGKLVGKTPGREEEHRLDLKHHRVDVRIQGNVAYTEVTEIFRNPTSQTLEGVYRFPLPPDAQISRLALKVGDEVMEGEFLETGRAQAIWRDVISTWRDPAMLEWKEGNTFELRIFPIEPHREREVTIGYTQRLSATAQGYRYTYPLPVDHHALIPAERFEIEAKVYGHDPTLPLDVLGYPGTIEHGASEADQPYSTVRFAQNQFVASGDLAIRFHRRQPSALGSYGYVEPDGSGYAVFTLRPELAATREVRPRDFVVVLDTSTSRRGITMDVQRRIVGRMIAEMDRLDRVAVVACSHVCTPVGKPGFQEVRTGLGAQIELDLIDRAADGATYPVEAARVAGELFRRRSQSDRAAHLVYFTDGVASAGELRPGPLADAVSRAFAPTAVRATIVDVGGTRDDTNLQALARGAGGRVVSVDPNLSTTGHALAILSEHYRSVLVAPTLDTPAGVSIDTSLPVALADGDELVVAARYEGEPAGELKLGGTLNGRPFEAAYAFALDRSSRPGNAFVPREWATHRIRTLEMQNLDAGDPKDEVVRLSKKFGVLSRYTTLLALESEEMMREYGVRAKERTQFDARELAVEADPEPVSAPTDEPSSLKTGSTSPSSGRGAPLPPMKAKKRAAPAPRPVTRSRIKPPPSVESASFDVLPAAEPERTTIQRKPQPPPRRRQIHRLPRRPRLPQVGDAKATTRWEHDNVANRRQRHFDDPDNRSKRMALIRAQIRATRISAARQGARDWLETNPMDPEAIVQLAQLEAIDGNVDQFYRLLVSAADAAPRGEWLLQRIRHAAESEGDEALACAYRIALEAVARKPPRELGDILACPMTTHVAGWFGDQTGPRRAPGVASRLTGALTAHLVMDDASDWDLALIEPSGRLLWWGSARQGLKTSGVRNSNEEWLALPSLRRGTYSVMVIPRRKVSERSSVTVTVETRGGSKTFRDRVIRPTEIAEVVVP